MRFTGAALAVASLLVIGSSDATARDFCIDSADGIRDAMDAIVHGSAPGESHTVRLVAGRYVIDNVSFFSGGALDIEGGYLPGCSAQTRGAGNTTIESPVEQTQDSLSLHAFGGDLHVSDLTIAGYAAVFMFPQGASYNIAVSRVAVILGEEQSGVELAAPGVFQVDDVLVDAHSSHCALRSEANAPQMAFVTVVNRGAGSGLCVSGYNAGEAASLGISNSIVQTESRNDLEFESGSSLIALYSVFDQIIALDPPSHDDLVGRISFDRRDDPLLRNRPADVVDQPARDSALALDGIEIDLLGNPRTSGSAPDRGAFEIASCDSIFRAGFDIACRRAQHISRSRHALSCDE